MRFFISYAREDQQVSAELASDVGRLGHDVWRDTALTGGQAWWDAILSEIRSCDGLLSVVSNASLESQAWNLELRYASELLKSIIPVGTESVVSELLPPTLAMRQFIDYSKIDRESTLQLSAALARVPFGPNLPNPLPPDPPVPVSYMSELTERMTGPTLSLDEQFLIVARLRASLERPSERVAATVLLERLRARRDLFYAVERELIVILGHAAPAAGNRPACEVVGRSNSDADSARAGTLSDKALLTEDQGPIVVQDGPPASFDADHELVAGWLDMREEQWNAALRAHVDELPLSHHESFLVNMKRLSSEVSASIEAHKSNEGQAWGNEPEDRMSYMVATLKTGAKDPEWLRGLRELEGASAFCQAVTEATYARLVDRRAAAAVEEARFAGADQDPLTDMRHQLEEGLRAGTIRPERGPYFRTLLDRIGPMMGQLNDPSTSLGDKTVLLTRFRTLASEFNQVFLDPYPPTE